MTGVQVGAALVASEAIVADVGAGRLGFLRYAIALVFLLPFGLRAAGPPFRKSDLLPVALIGIGQFGVLVALLNIAVLYSSSARVSLVFATLPIVTLAVGWAMAREAITARTFIAIALSVIGVGVLVGADALSGALAASDPDRPRLRRTGHADRRGLFQPVSPLSAPLRRCQGERHRHGGIPRAARRAWPAGDPWRGHGPTGPAATMALIGFVGLSSGIGYLMWLYAAHQCTCRHRNRLPRAQPGHHDDNLGCLAGCPDEQRPRHSPRPHSRRPGRHPHFSGSREGRETGQVGSKAGVGVGGWVCRRCRQTMTPLERSTVHGRVCRRLPVGDRRRRRAG